MRKKIELKNFMKITLIFSISIFSYGCNNTCIRQATDITKIQNSTEAAIGVNLCVSGSKTASVSLNIVPGSKVDDIVIRSYEETLDDDYDDVTQTYLCDAELPDAEYIVDVSVLGMMPLGIKHCYSASKKENIFISDTDTGGNPVNCPTDTIEKFAVLSCG